jgi:signal transduction histidine kinase
MVSVEMRDTAPAASSTGVADGQFGGRGPRWWWRGGELIGFRLTGTSSWRGTARSALILFVVGVAAWILGLHGIWTVPDWLWTESAADEWHLVTLAVATSAVLLQRVHVAFAFAVGGAMVVVDMALGGSVGMLIVHWELLLGVGLSGSLRIRRLTTGAVAAVVAGAVAVAQIAERDLQFGIVTGIQFLVLLALPLWWAATVRHKTELADLAARRAADSERIGELRRTEAVQAERSAVARDLHDAIASRLSTIAMRSAAGLTAPDRDQNATLRVVRSQALEALREMRSMIVVLRSETHQSTPGTPPMVVGGLERLDEMVSTARAAGLRVETDVPGRWTDTTAALPAAVGQACFRIAQEALANATKHAPGSEVRIALSGDEAEVRTVIENSLTSVAAVDHPHRDALGQQPAGQREAGRAGSDDEDFGSLHDPNI